MHKQDIVPPFHCTDCGEYFGTPEIPVCQCNSHFVTTKEAQYTGFISQPVAPLTEMTFNELLDLHNSKH